MASSSEENNSNISNDDVSDDYFWWKTISCGNDLKMKSNIDPLHLRPTRYNYPLNTLSLTIFKIHQNQLQQMTNNSMAFFDKNSDIVTGTSQSSGYPTFGILC